MVGCHHHAPFTHNLHTNHNNKHYRSKSLVLDLLLYKQCLAIMAEDQKQDKTNLVVLKETPIVGHSFHFPYGYAVNIFCLDHHQTTVHSWNFTCKWCHQFPSRSPTNYNSREVHTHEASHAIYKAPIWVRFGGGSRTRKWNGQPETLAVLKFRSWNFRTWWHVPSCWIWSRN